MRAWSSWPGHSRGSRLSLVSCDGFSTDGLPAIATHCKKLTELDIQENAMDDISGGWLICFPENFTSLEILNFASLNSEVTFDALERLVSRCKGLKVLKVNKGIWSEQLQRLIVRAPQLIELVTGSRQYLELQSTFRNCKNLQTLAGLWDASALYLPVLYPTCTNLTFLNLSYATLRSDEFEKLVANCLKLQHLWVLDTVEDKGLGAVGSCCPLL